jgi:hypothetical protein
MSHIHVSLLEWIMIAQVGEIHRDLDIATTSGDTLRLL